MKKRVVVFENDPEDQHRFQEVLKEVGCEILLIDHCNVSKEASEIEKFGPDMAIVDSHFSEDLDGLDIIRQLANIAPKVPIVVCSILLNKSRKRNWIQKHYEKIPIVKKIVPKTEKRFPTAHDLLV